MRKSNWIIIAILIVTSIIFLGIWFYFGFNLVDNPLDLVITIFWWLLIIAICIVINKFEKERCRAIRTMFLGSDTIYNSEAGVISLGKDGRYVPVMRKTLSDLDYGFKVKDVTDSEHNRICFQRIVNTDSFKNNGRTWEGEVIEVANPNNPHEFKSMTELSNLLDGKQQ